MAGNLSDEKSVWDFTYDIMHTLNQAIPLSRFDTYLNICPHDNMEQLHAAKETGVKWVQYNMEVAGEKDYTKICPGKTPYHVLLNKYREAVDVFGFGKVRSNFVLGLQPVYVLIDGVRELSELGVVPDYSIFQPKRGTKAEFMPIPSLNEIFAFNEALMAIYRKHNFDPIYCNMSSRSSIINEGFTLQHHNTPLA